MKTGGAEEASLGVPGSTRHPWWQCPCLRLLWLIFYQKLPILTLASWPKIYIFSFLKVIHQILDSIKCWYARFQISLIKLSHKNLKLLLIGLDCCWTSLDRMLAVNDISFLLVYYLFIPSCQYCGVFS